MKANEPKRKIFADAVDLIGGNKVMVEPGITMLDVELIRPFHNHPFRLYEGERLQDMVEATPLSSGLVKAKTGNTTDTTVYNDWYKSVYMPVTAEDDDGGVA